VVAAEAASERFHARYDARAKLYRYRIWNGTQRSPLRRERCLRVVAPLDLIGMRAAARALLGRHDFASFQAARSEVRTTVRTLSRFDVVEPSPGELSIWVEGDGFLRHMVRIAVGTLVEVGQGRREAASLPAVLAARDRRAAGRTAPGQGLTLVRVCY
jgi:tRNA pseudouridine38-40 synthase